MENGVWRTIRGRHVFIQDGQSLSDALKDTSWKKKNKKSEIKKEKKDILSKEEYDKAIPLEERSKYADASYENYVKEAKDAGLTPTNNGGGKDDNSSLFAQEAIDYWNKQKQDTALKGGNTDWEDSAINRWEAEKSIRLQNEASNQPRFKEGDKVLDGKSMTTVLQVKNDPRYGADYLVRGDEGNKWTNRLDEQNPEINYNPKELQKNAYDNLLKEQGRRQADKEFELYKQAKENPDSIDAMTENSTNWDKLNEKYSIKEKPASLQDRLKERIGNSKKAEVEAIPMDDNEEIRGAAYDAIGGLDDYSTESDLREAADMLDSYDISDSDIRSRISDASSELNEAADIAYDIEKLENLESDSTSLQDFIDNYNDIDYGNGLEYITDDAKQDLITTIVDNTRNADNPTIGNAAGIWGYDEWIEENPDGDLDQFVDEVLQEKDYDELRDTFFDVDFKNKAREHFVSDEEYSDFSREIEQVDTRGWQQMRNEVDDAIDSRRSEIQEHIGNANSYIEDIEDNVPVNNENGLKVNGSRPIAEKLALQEKTKGRAIANISRANITEALDRDLIKNTDQGLDYANLTTELYTPQNYKDMSFEDVLETEKSIAGSNLTTMEDYLKKLNAQTMRRLGSQMLTENEVIEMYIKKGMSKETAIKMAKKYLKTRK